ncbi:hypothetical protein [Deinococcus peraridilitoris]|uniref:Uncharacterized protein n=1 Tax=Deinococcus peraridilitoris (strain DSM 19664 / LMG 22246 / CIP 109416 / KR-200) TaxID=937777 RepID=L0A2I9_DEIPD|nr:hypothetical protein [Deinococcus peraridilitoris]AFZ67412.1 hypothetical protein Deipe_1904 [Deinococcus peraridilitoris DSM 19664]
MSQSFVYGLADYDEWESVVALPRDRLLELAWARYAVQFCRTWGEVKSTVSPAIYQELVESYLDEDSEEETEAGPLSDAPFGTPSGYDDGDWPGWPKQEMLEVIPQEIRDEYGEIQDTTLSGEYLHVPPEEMDDFVKDLRDLGISCERDDALVQAASGSSTARSWRNFFGVKDKPAGHPKPDTAGVTQVDCPSTASSRASTSRAYSARSKQ